MDIKKLFMGGIAGGIAFFLLGWVIFGKLLSDFMNSHPGVVGNVHRPEPDMLYLAIGNLVWGFLFAYIFIRAGVNTMVGGLITGGIVGCLISIGSNCVMYGVTNITSKSAMAADVAGMTVMCAVGGAIIGMVLGMSKKV